MVNSEFIKIKDKLDKTSTRFEAIKKYLKIFGKAFISPNHFIFRISVPLCLVHPAALPVQLLGIILEIPVSRIISSALLKHYS